MPRLEPRQFWGKSSIRAKPEQVAVEYKPKAVEMPQLSWVICSGKNIEAYASEIWVPPGPQTADWFTQTNIYPYMSQKYNVCFPTKNKTKQKQEEKKPPFKEGQIKQAISKDNRWCHNWEVRRVINTSQDPAHGLGACLVWRENWPSQSTHELHVAGACLISEWSRTWQLISWAKEQGKQDARENHLSLDKESTFSSSASETSMLRLSFTLIFVLSELPQNWQKAHKTAQNRKQLASRTVPVYSSWCSLPIMIFMSASLLCSCRFFISGADEQYAKQNQEAALGTLVHFPGWR